MGLKVLTLARLSVSGGLVKVHSSGRKAKVIAKDANDHLEFFLRYVDDPEQKEYRVHFNVQLQGFATEQHEELDADTEDASS